MGICFLLLLPQKVRRGRVVAPKVHQRAALTLLLAALIQIAAECLKSVQIEIRQLHFAEDIFICYRRITAGGVCLLIKAIQFNNKNRKTAGNLRKLFLAQLFELPVQRLGFLFQCR